MIIMLYYYLIYLLDNSLVKKSILNIFLSNLLYFYINSYKNK